MSHGLTVDDRRRRLDWDPEDWGRRRRMVSYSGGGLSVLAGLGRVPCRPFLGVSGRRGRR